MEETPKKIKCLIWSSSPFSKNKIYVFGKSSVDLAWIIELSREIKVDKYSVDSNLFVCQPCFWQLTKYERAAKKLQEIRQELKNTFKNRVAKGKETRTETRQRRTRNNHCWRWVS